MDLFFDEFSGLINSVLRFSDIAEREAVGFACSEVVRVFLVAVRRFGGKVPGDRTEAFVLIVDVADNIASFVRALARRVGEVDRVAFEGVVPIAIGRVRDDLAILVVKAFLAFSFGCVVPIRVDSLVSPSVEGVERPDAEVTGGGGDLCGHKRLCKKQE
jgi:hypothetical protein